MGPNDESLNDSMDLSLMATIQGNVQAIHIEMFICNNIVQTLFEASFLVVFFNIIFNIIVEK